MSQTYHDWTLSEAVVASHAVALRRLQPQGRLALRMGVQDRVAIERALGTPLPEGIGQRVQGAGMDILQVGPDEWHLVGPFAATAAAEAGCAAIYATTPHSLVDVSGREVTFLLEGSKADVLLTLGMARDPRTIPLGQGRRTTIDGLTVIVRREGAQSFLIDVWNSFADHLWHLFETGAHELAAE